MKTNRILAWGAGGLVLLAAGWQVAGAGGKGPMRTAQEVRAMKTEDLPKTDAEWKSRLTAEQYRILRRAGTERPFGDVYNQFKKQGAGTYHCAGCGLELFSSGQRFDARCGWPAFWDPAKSENVRLKPDTSHGMRRTEVVCARCDGHLGHLFAGEGFPTPTDRRYCINGLVLVFVPGTAGESSEAGEDKSAASGKPEGGLAE